MPSGDVFGVGLSDREGIVIEDATPTAEPVTAEHHANWLHEIFTALDEVLYVAEDPAVLSLLSPRHREMAIAAIGAVKRIKSATQPAEPT